MIILLMELSYEYSKTNTCEGLRPLTGVLFRLKDFEKPPLIESLALEISKVYLFVKGAFFLRFDIQTQKEDKMSQ